jgi:predicted anti-sigma-YlaC factor YlaD
MNCNEIRERMPDVAAGFDAPTLDEGKHLESCGACAEQLKAMRSTMALLDEWQTPEPSPYFDMRLQARLREEMAKPQAGWLQWFRRPVLAAALTVLMGVGVGLFFTRTSGIYTQGRSDISMGSFGAPERGTAVSDLQDLEQNHDLYSNYEVLDDLDLQQDVVANP